MKKLAVLLAAALLVLADPTPLTATRVVSYTLQNVVRSDIHEIAISLDGSGQVVERVSYALRDQTGAVVKSGQLVLPLTPAQRTALLSHIDTVVLPAITTAEGL